MIETIRDFFKTGIWRIKPEELSFGQRFLLRLGQVAARVGHDFIADRCLLRASALTYTSLLSFIPMLALMFAVLKGLGVQNRLEPVLLEHIAVGSEQALSKIIEYINNTNVGRLGTFGLVFLVLTVLTLLSNIEDSFNSIWYVRETRSLMRRFSDYFSVVILGPIFLVLAITMTATLEAQGFVLQLKQMAYVGTLVIFLFNVLPYFAMWAAFAFLYIFMPNIKVSLRAAMVGGLVGGTLWQLTQWGYVNFQVGVARYNAIYGTMAALPIFMVWLYISWLIVLLGLEVSYAWQNLRYLRQEQAGGEESFANRELLALRIMLIVGDRFQKGEAPPDLGEIAGQLSLAPRLTRSIVNDLVRLRLLSEVSIGEDVSGYQPARALSALPVFELLKTIEGNGAPVKQARESHDERIVGEIADRLYRVGSEALDGLTLADLVGRYQQETVSEST
ncbi:YhjD/YihY/BrkB family envelope integrity protein [Geothermobacter hydrogeniphilus]|uniref:tRNA-processing RNAse BN n=1 Tax=Geothermobacter hydrogeniphilus TaxID=1969733 RepID=A0A1X0YCK1_9BACT|nr:YhjD/YihY/BrkB family envelope integrity protein [Geothermobacter hydrogeniphilus]ORJ62846.1 hypothetical protein B5V00_01955 [Geothermobacter hydrogeniphilus]